MGGGKHHIRDFTEHGPEVGGLVHSPCPVQHSQDSRVRSGRVSPGPGPSDPVRREHGLGEHGFPGEGQGGVVSLGHGGIRTVDLINIKDSELAVIVLQENGTRIGLGKLGHRVPDFSDPGLVTRYQVEVLQPVEGRSSDSFPAFRGVPTFHVKVGPLFAFRRSGESHNQVGGPLYGTSPTEINDVA
jgi:hypothetical protein